MRLVIRGLLVIAVIVAAAVIVVALGATNQEASTRWVVIAAGLAVVAAVASAYGAQRVVELEEDRRRPSVYAQLDLTSRYGLAQFVLVNKGGGPAYSVRVDWRRQLANSKGEPIAVSDIVTLLPGERVYSKIDEAVQLFAQPDIPNSEGVIRYRDDPDGRETSREFTLSLEQYRGQLTHSDEIAYAAFRLQDLPRRLEAIERALGRRQGDEGRRRLPHER